MSERISSQQAAKKYGVTNDYVARPCRRGKLVGVLEGRTWMIDQASLENFFAGRGRPAADTAPAYLSSREAARLYRVTNDYISRLCRQGKLTGMFEHGVWRVEKKSLDAFFAPKREAVQLPAENTVAHVSAPVRTIYAQPVLQKVLSTVRNAEQTIPRNKKFAFAAGVLALVLVANAAAFVSTNFQASSPAAVASLQSPFFGGSLISKIFSALFSARVAQTPTPRDEYRVVALPPAATHTPVAAGTTTQPVYSVIARAESDTIPTNVLLVMLDELHSSVKREVAHMWDQTLDLDFFTSSNSGGGSGGLSVSDLTDTNIPDTITVSNYLPLAGGTLTGALAGVSATFTGTASTSALIVSGLNSADCDVKASINGTLFCGSDSTGIGGGSFPFTPTTYGNATSTTIGFTEGLLSTASSTFTSNITFSNYTNSSLAVNAGGQVYAAATTTFSVPLVYSNGNVTLTQSGTATDGYLSSTDWNLFNSKVSSSSLATLFTSIYPFPLTGNATSTLTQFNGGLTAYASSTIGDGTQTGGLTIAGGATTTGNAYFAGNVGINVAAPAYRVHIGRNDSASSLVIGNGGGQSYGTQYAGGVLDVTAPLSELPKALISFRREGGNGDWGITLGNESVANLYIGATNSTSDYYWRANWNNVGTPANTFQSPEPADNALTVAEFLQKRAGNTGDYIHVTSSGAASGNIFTIANSGNLGIGTTSPYTRLSVQGNAGISGDLGVANITATGTLSVAGNTTLTNATSTNLAITNVLSSLLKTNSAGSIIPAIAGTDYATPSQITSAFPFTPTALGNSTSTLLQLNAGVIALASSTIGDGTQTGGLTIAGGATTTGDALVQGSQIINNKLSLPSGTSASAGAPTITLGLTTSGIYADSSSFRTLISANGTAALSVGTNGVAVFRTGSAASPSIHNNNSTGLFFPAAGELAITANGVEAARFNTSQDLGIGTTTPYTKLSVQGNAGISGNLGVANVMATGTVTTANLTIGALSGLLKATAGVVSTATAGVDYVTPSALIAAFPFTPTALGNATSTLLQLNAGVIALASSTIGNGSQTGGLTISGGATTTGNAYFAGNVGIGTASPSSALTVSGDINFSGKLLEDGNEVFATMIAPFAGSCPTGWSEYTAARGRTVVGTPSGGTNAGTVGTALTNLGTRTITDVAAHTHTVDPPSTNTSTNGAHTHTEEGVTNGSGGTDWSTTGNDLHVVNQNTGSSGSHSHTVDIAQFDSGSTGVASVDVTMPYIQLTYCQKTAGADLAEWVPASEPVAKASIVSVDPEHRERVVASRSAYDTSMVGIVATKPGWLIGEEAKGSVQLALAGRVPLKVSLKNGEIRPGDPITSSGIPGVGMRATQAGPMVGKAMEALNETSALTSCLDPATGLEEQCGEVLVFVNVSWYAPLGDAYATVQSDTHISGTYYETLSLASDFEDGDIATLSYAYAAVQGNPGESEKTARLRLAQTSDFPVGIISKKIGGPGELLRRTRSNNHVTEELRLVTSGKADVRVAPNSQAIALGDPVVLSQEYAGMGARASSTGPIMGRALEEWHPGDSKKTIAVLVGQSWYNPPNPVVAGQEGEHADQASDLAVDTSWPESFWNNLFAKVTAWLADAGNGIADLFATTIHAETVYAKAVHTEELCVGAVCVSEQEFLQLVGDHGHTPTEPANQQDGQDESTTMDMNSATDTATSSPAGGENENVPPAGEESNPPVPAVDENTTEDMVIPPPVTQEPAAEASDTNAPPAPTPREQEVTMGDPTSSADQPADSSPEGITSTEDNPDSI